VSTQVTFRLCMGPPGEALARALRNAGYDYYEPGVATVVMGQSRADFDAHLSSWSEGGLEPRSANLFLPGELKVVGPKVQPEKVQAHVHVCGPDRHPPAREDENCLVALFEKLAAIGYRGRISIEANFADIEAEAPAALGVVRHAAEVAGLA
jgi:hypothetical protein